MIFIIALMYASVFLLIFHNSLKKYPNQFYIISILIATSLILYKYYDLKIYFPDFINKYFIQVFRRGAFTTALFTFVMWLPIFKGKFQIIKVLYGIRAEISIVASIITLGHNISYGLTYFPQIFLSPEKMKPGTYTATLITFLMIALMTILTLTSLPSIRKKISYKSWKKIQNSAYVFYILIYVHVMILFFYSDGNKFFDISVYSTIFIGYFILRIFRHYIDHNKIKTQLKKI